MFAYIQLYNSTTPVYNISGVNAFHVLYYNLTLDTALDTTQTFGASIYEDGSIRVSYADVDFTSRVTSDDFAGLWGSFAYKEPSRYHQETLFDDVITSGVDVVYCPLSALACVPQSCVAAGETLSVNWNGTNTCTALGSSSQLLLTCSWAGGLATTAATFTPAPNNVSLASVSCEVPTLDFIEGTLLSVDLVVSVTSTEEISTEAASSAQPGSSTIYMVTSRGQEVARSNLQVRYYSGTNGTLTGYSECGCSALTSNVTHTCDAAFVCGGSSTYYYSSSSSSSSSYLDCAGTPFGAAFTDSCGDCVFGMTGNLVAQDCSDDDSGGSGSGGFLDLVSQTIILLIIICCMTFVTSTISYSIRRMLIRRRLEEQQEFEFEADLYMVRNGGVGGHDRPNRRGLSEFECDALGTIIFTQEFYREHKKKQLELMHGIAAKSADGVNSPGTANGMGGCDCPICLMDIMEGNVVRALPDPCGHVFHVACIDQWFKQSHVCPLCKRSMRAILEGEEESTSDSDLNPAGNSTTRYPTRTHSSGFGDSNGRSVGGGGGGAFDRLRNLIHSSGDRHTSSGGAGGAGGSSGSMSGGNHADPEAGIALTRFGGTDESDVGGGNSSPAAERGGSSRHFEL